MVNNLNEALDFIRDKVQQTENSNKNITNIRDVFNDVTAWLGNNHYNLDLTGTTDSSVQLQALIDSTPVGGTAILPTGKILLTSGVTISNSIDLISNRTTIETSSAIKAITIDSDSVSIRNIDFLGSGGFTGNQYGIFINSKNDFKIQNCKFDTVYHGIGFESTILTGNFVTSEISNCYFKSNNIGIDGGERGEYVNIFGCRGLLNTTDMQYQGGNININSCILTGGSSGIKMLNGANDSHGIISNCEINHMGTPLTFDGITKGMTVNGVHVFQGNILLKNCSGVTFKGCMFDVGNFQFENAVGSAFYGTRHLTAYTNNVDKTFNGSPASTVIAKDNIELDGTTFVF